MSRIKITLPPEHSGISKEEYIKECVKKIVYPYLDVKLYYIAEFKGECEVILQDKFDHKERFEQQVNNIAYKLEDFAYAGVTQHILEDDRDKIMLTFQIRGD